MDPRLTFLPLCLLAAACLGQNQPSPPAIKNVIIMIGDGMGPQQVGFLEAYARQAPQSIYRTQGRVTAIGEAATQGHLALSLHHPKDGLVVDSACSATQLATGVFSGSEMIGIDHQGNQVETVLEVAKRLGKKTALISDTRITHATPASFASHQPHRSKENAIAKDLLDLEVDVLLSGGLRNFLPKEINQAPEAEAQTKKQFKIPFAISSKRQDSNNLLDVAQQKGYQLAFDRGQLQQIKEAKILGLFANSGMKDGIQHHQRDLQSFEREPTLAEMTQKALTSLEHHPNGFFMMVEGGQIDWAAHNNDAGTMLHEIIKFDQAIATIMSWMKGRDDTLLLITADHETGSFGLSYKSTDLPKSQELPGDVFQGHQFKPYFNFGKPETLDQIFGQTKSFQTLFNGFHSLPTQQQSTAWLKSAVKGTTGYSITEDEASRLIQKVQNPYYSSGHTYLGTEEVYHIGDLDAYYPYLAGQQTAILARQLSTKQNVVWGTGTHTHTPVMVITLGPKGLKPGLRGLVHHTDVGQYLKGMVQNNP